ncbi:hypothetical protein E5843_06730 [Luteimonas yindakuii]|uniref:hypothetical protein n=1 Tax=Luteimonas yindakuii TaxID=2565782 RepID=UPI0010A586B6|nr:hypothetical protein [Luteimonas yindakuii]QCO67542.1 hypothetical protein E5843_06730 [Luteimonas yindakuii]
MDVSQNLISLDVTDEQVQGVLAALGQIEAALPDLLSMETGDRRGLMLMGPKSRLGPADPTNCEQASGYRRASAPKVPRLVPLVRRSCRISLLALTAVVLMGCNRQPPAAQPEELEPHSSFEVGYRPSMNTAHAVANRLQGSGLGLEGIQVPGYADLEFFPITRPDMFEESPAMQRLRRSEQPPDLADIDFDTQFAFLVAHPGGNSYANLRSGQMAQFFSDVAVSYTDEAVVLHLEASRLGTLDPVAAMSGGWAGDIYAVPRRDRGQVEVHLDDQVYRYSLIDGFGFDSSAGTGADAEKDGPAN